MAVPDDDNVMNGFSFNTTADLEANQDDAASDEDIDNGLNLAAVPNLLASCIELDIFRQQAKDSFQPQQALQAASQPLSPSHLSAQLHSQNSIAASNCLAGHFPPSIHTAELISAYPVCAL